MTKMNANEIEGIHFIHIPKCGGTYVKDHLLDIVERAGIKWSGHEHRYFHEGIHAPPENFLTVAVVRNPYDLFVSMWNWDEKRSDEQVGAKHKSGRGYGDVREMFPDFKSFVLYFALVNDHSYAVNGDWFYSVEPFHFSCDLNGDPRTPEWISDNPENVWELNYLEWALQCRPKAFTQYTGRDFHLADDTPFLNPDGSFRSYSFLDVNEEGKTLIQNYRAAWYTHMKSANPHPVWKAQPENNDELSSNYGWIYEAGQRNFDLSRLGDAWYYMSFLWYSLFKWNERQLIPDVIIPIEHADRGIQTISDFLGVEYKAISGARRNSGKTRNRQPYQGYYDDQTIQIISDFMKPDLELWGYGFNRTPELQYGCFAKEQFCPELFIPRIPTVGAPWHELLSPPGRTKFRNM